MDQLLQFAITTVVGILGILAGRVWERYDRRTKKDKELIEKIISIVPVESESLLLLRKHDFGTWFERRLLRPIRDLDRLLEQPSYFFLNKKLEKKKTDLQHAIDDFLIFEIKNTFPHRTQSELQGLDEPLEKDEIVAYRREHSLEDLSDDELIGLENVLLAKYHQTKGALNSKSSEVCNKYDDLIMAAHRIL